MYLLTIAQFEQLLKNGSSEERGKDHIPVVKLFLPGTGCTWLLTEIEPDNHDIAFGLCDLGMGFPELGYVSFEEILSIKSKLILRIENDSSFRGKYPISVYARAARSKERIIDDAETLGQFVKSKPKDNI